MRSAESIQAEIVERFGFFPPFYQPALANPTILENLWQQTLSGYIDNPIPALFKEKLAALVSRYCPVPYCLVCHTSNLRPLGMAAPEILALLERPVPDVDDLMIIVTKARSSIQQPLVVWPKPGSEVDEAILYLAIDVFRQPEGNLPYHASLKELLSPFLFDSLVMFLAYNKTCLTWAEAHPELPFEADQRAIDNLAPLVNEEPRLSVFLRDYTPRFQRGLVSRQRAKTLRKTEKLFKLVVEGVMDYAIIVIDLDGFIAEWNIGAERILGYKEEDVVGQSIEIFFTPEDRAAGVPAKELARARETGHALDERYHLRQDGMRLWVKGFMTAVKSEDGTLQAYAKIIQDLTDRKKIEDELARWNEELEDRVQKRTQELANSQDALHQAQKLEAVGQLAGGVAHDFNNLITGILGMSEDLKSSMPASDPRRDDVEEIIKASNRAFGVTRQLLAFGRRQIIQPNIVEVKAVVGELQRLLERVLGEDIEIRVQLAETSGIKIDQGQLEQVLMNLAINARDAMPNGGTLVIKTENVELEEGDSDRHFQVAAGPYVKIEVSDTGHGMTKDVLAHIFEPFFTTKEKDRGTGLGLSTVYGIIKQSGGDIYVYSEPGLGTSFKMYFPVATGDRLVSDRKPSAVKPALGQQTILVVEDEDIVRKVVIKRLKKEGYHVIEARHGKEALELINASTISLDLIVTDVVMPGMNGKEVVDRLHEVWPGVPALYMSGYPEDIIAHRGILSPGIDFIEKSNLASGLAAKVRDVIDKSRASVEVSV